MERMPEYRFSGSVTIFHDQHLPEEATPVGYAALIEVLSLRVPLRANCGPLATATARLVGMAGT